MVCHPVKLGTPFIPYRILFAEAICRVSKYTNISLWNTNRTPTVTIRLLIESPILDYEIRNKKFQVIFVGDSSGFQCLLVVGKTLVFVRRCVFPLPDSRLSSSYRSNAWYRGGSYFFGQSITRRLSQSNTQLNVSSTLFCRSNSACFCS